MTDTAPTTRAAVLTALNQPLAVLDGVRVPALRDGQVLVDIAYTGVCRSQLMEARGQRGEDRWLPHMLGHEASGRVRAVGAGVCKVRVGDLVILTWIRGHGADSGGAQYAGAAGTINAGGVTTFSDMAVVSENRVVKLPDGVPLKTAVLFGCALPTGAGIVFNELQPRPGTRIAVFGLGGIGLCALMACALHEFQRVIAVDVAPAKLDLARQLGAHSVLDASACDPVREIRAQTGGRGVDYAVEASGRCRVIEQAFEATCTGHGTTVFASHPPAGEKISLDPFALINGKRIWGSWGGHCAPDTDFPRYAGFYRAGKLPLDRLTERTYRLDDINVALDDLEQGRVERPIIEINPHV